ncbi:MAG: hypothetical protein ACI3Z7_01255 [Candidatus Aphodosoma sp.]
MKKTFAFSAIVIMALGLGGCGSPEAVLEGSWDKAVKEAPFLENFPKYGHDFQGTYQKVLGVEMYQLADWNSTEGIWDDYRAKLVGAGFSEEKNEFVEQAFEYEKTVVDGELTANTQFVSGKVLITYTLEPNE